MNKKYISLSVVVIMAGAALLSGCSPKSNGATAKVSHAVPVETMTVKSGTLGGTAMLSGQINPGLQTKVVSKISGKVSQVFVKIGDKVAAGQTLVQLDTSDLQAQLQQQQAAVQVAAAQVDKAKSDAQNTYQSAYISANSAVASAKVTLQNDQTTYNRQQSLYAAGATSKSQLDAAAQAVQNDQIKLDQAQQQLQYVMNNQSPQGQDSIKVAEAQLQQAQANLAVTQNQISESTVTAPVAGVVVSQDVEVGGFAGTSSSVVTLASVDTVKASVNIPETLIDQIHVGMQVKVTASAIGNQTYTATISRVSSTEDPTSKAYTAEVDIKNSDGQLKPGMVAQVTIEGLKTHPGLVIPANALVQTPDGPKVFTVENNVAHQHLLQLGTIESSQVEVLSGLKEGDVLVTAGQELLGEGAGVTTGQGQTPGQNQAPGQTKGKGNKGAQGQGAKPASGAAQ